MPDLSICITTCDRADLLGECLASIDAAVAGVEDHVELFILDNGSTDETWEVVTDFAATRPWTRLQRHERGVDPNINFYRLAEAATAPYAWIFGDDDRMHQDAVREVLASLARDPTLVVLDYSIWSKDFQTEYRASILP